MTPETEETPSQDFDVLVMRFVGIGHFAVDFNLYGSVGRYATLTLRPTDFRIQKTNRHGMPKEGSAAFPTLWTWRLTEIRSARVFKSPWWIRMAGINASYPSGMVLDMGASGWNLLLFSRQLDSLLQAFGDQGVGIAKNPRTLTPLVFRREI